MKNLKESKLVYRIKPVSLLFGAVICIVLLCSQKAYSQTFHYFKYQVPDSSSASFEALLTLFADGTATARVRRLNIPDEPAPVFELELADSTTSENMGLQVRQLIARKAEDITNPSAGPMIYQPLFEFKKQVENQLEFYIADGIKISAEGKWNPAIVTENKEFSSAEIDTNLVKQFYAPGTEYYSQLFGNMQEPGLTSRGGLNEQQKKMKIWMIIVTDLLDPTVGKSCARDKENISYTFTNIAKKMGLQPPVISYINGPQFSRQSVLAAITNIKPSADDMVIFYYSGHGYREKNEGSDLPKMILSNDYTFDNLAKKSLSIQAIVDSLSKKKSRFNLVINDCCNVECCPVPSPGLGKDPVVTQKSIGLPVSTENFIKLFLEPRGTVIASSSRPREYSVGNPEKGGFFTWYLRISLEKQLSQYNRDIAWENIFYEAGRNANYLALTGLCGEENNKRRCIQNPWYDVSNLNQE